MERFPAVQVLASAPFDDVLKQWEGLGYYSRAHNLHRAARQVVSEFGGQLPETVEGLSKLPGIGRYTAGAIASLAFGCDAPVVDGNVKRVLARFYAIRGDVRLPKVERELWALAESNLPKGRAGRWNEAMMELGATICTPRSPRCDECPLARVCRARALDMQEALPERTAKKRMPHYDVTSAVIQKRNRVLIAQRPVGGMLGGLWEFPGGKRERGETLEECLRREIQEELGIEIEVGELVTQVRHTYTHFCITLHALECCLVRGRPRAIQVADWRWARLDELEDLAFAVTDRKIIQVLKKKRR
jgi:A/G-specific adenine glycosylase